MNKIKIMINIKNMVNPVIFIKLAQFINYFSIEELMNILSIIDIDKKYSFTKELCADKNFSKYMDVIKYLKTDDEIRRQIFLYLRECMNNDFSLESFANLCENVLTSKIRIINQISKYDRYMILYNLFNAYSIGSIDLNNFNININSIDPIILHQIINLSDDLIIIDKLIYKKIENQSICNRLNTCMNLIKNNELFDDKELRAIISAFIIHDDKCTMNVISINNNKLKDLLQIKIIQKCFMNMEIYNDKNFYMSRNSTLKRLHISNNIIDRLIYNDNEIEDYEKKIKILFKYVNKISPKLFVLLFKILMSFNEFEYFDINKICEFEKTYPENARMLIIRLVDLGIIKKMHEGNIHTKVSYYYEY